MARTVLLVDDHAPFRAVARALLQLNSFAVVGEALGGLPAMEAVGRLRPNVVLLDLRLPRLRRLRGRPAGWLGWTLKPPTSISTGRPNETRLAEHTDATGPRSGPSGSQKGYVAIFGFALGFAGICLIRPTDTGSRSAFAALAAAVVGIGGALLVRQPGSVQARSESCLPLGLQLIAHAVVS